MSEEIKDFVDQEKDAATAGGLKEKAAEIVEDVKEKAAPVVNKVKDAAEMVKDSVSRLAGGERPTLNVNNELFNALGEEVAEQREAAAQKAAEMQRKIEEMLGGKG